VNKRFTSAVGLTWLYMSVFRERIAVPTMAEPWTLAPQTAEMLVALARESAPNEVCGLIWGNRVVCVENDAEDPTSAFHMNSAEQKRALIRNRRPPSAIWHSHPTDTFLPSGDDLDSLPGDIPSVIACPNGRIGVWLDGILQSEYAQP
jgi:proteasome lid subunit RPN8/RPN11